MEQDKEILLKFAKRNNLKKIYGNKEKLSVVTYK
jgi:hypothetical protein